jgi:hypothetical protein
VASLRRIGRSIRDIKADIAKQSRSVAHDIAQRVAPSITALARDAYTSGRNVYGDARPRGANGQALSLIASGDTFSDLRFRVSGTVLWCDLGTPYAKYLIGKYKIMPIGDRTAVPVDWSRTIRAITDEVLRQSMGARRAA